MRGNAESVESILARAEKLFAKGNYTLAKTELEKAARMDEGVDVAEKIEICRKEMDRLRAKDLVKRARKLLSKNSLREAIRCYEQAHCLCGDDRIREKAESLKAELDGRDARKAAAEAEAGGDHLKAALLYQQAHDMQGDAALLLRKAHCLVKAGAYGEAVPIFESTGFSPPEAAYDYGFALAATGRYHPCLKAWEALSSGDPRFLAQREAVRSLLTADLFNRFEDARDYGAIYAEGLYLLNSGKGNENPPELAARVEYSKYAWIETLWQQERYELLADILLPVPDRMDPALLSLYAKVFFKSAETTGKHLKEFARFWLTAVYDRELSSAFAPDPQGRAQVRTALIYRGERLMERLAESGNDEARMELAWWKLEKKRIEELHILAGDREDLGRVVCTPRFAEHFGRSARILQLVQENRERFDDSEHYLEAGSCYTAARESLYRLHRGQYDEALAFLPETHGQDEFTRYAILKVHYSCGLHGLEEGEGSAAHLIQSSVDLFDIAPRYEAELAQKAVDAVELYQLESFEEALSVIHRVRPSRRLAEALSLVMSTRAIKMYNRDKLSSRGLEVVMKKALDLNPGNENARLTLTDTRAEQEIMELDRAIYKHKMNKAYRIASESRHPEVRDHFFTSLEELVDDLELESASFEKNQRLLILDDLRAWCAMMDASHPLVDRIDDLIRETESARS